MCCVAAYAPGAGGATSALRPGRVPAKRRPVRSTSVAACVLACAVLIGDATACATTRGGPQALSSIDVIDVDGRLSSLHAHAGRVLAVDVCATWADACHLNARALDDAAEKLRDTDARFVTILLDDLPREAMRAYVEVAGRKVPVVAAGPRTREGRSVLGDVNGVPRLVVFDRGGRVVVDESGGVLSAEGLVQRVRPLL